MNSSGRCLRGLPALLWLAGAALAAAHTGFENNTDIRILPDEMRVVVRASHAFAAAMLDGAAPSTRTPEGREQAQPLLAAAAGRLFEITAGGAPLAPTKAECRFEVEDDVVFLIDFPRPTQWPARVEARFFGKLGGMDSGAISVTDSSASRFDRNAEPFLRQRLDANHTAVSFSPGELVALTAPVPPILPTPPVSAPDEPLPPRFRHPWLLIPLIIALGALVGVIADRIKRRRQGGG